MAALSSRNLQEKGVLNTIARPTIEFTAPRSYLAKNMEAEKRRSLRALMTLDPVEVPLEVGASATAPDSNEAVYTSKRPAC